MLRDLAAQEDGFLFLSESQRSEFAHAPVAHHLSRDVRGSFDVVARAGGDMAEENLLGGAAAHQDGERADQVVLRVGVLVVDRQAAS